MKIINSAMIMLLMVFGISCQQQGETSVSNQKETDIEVKVAALLHQMTIEEKVGQMTQVTLDVLTQGKDAYSSYEPIVLDTVKLREAFEVYQIGSVLNTANNRARSTAFWNSLVQQVQDYAISHSRLNIPVIYGLDMIHGASYVDKSTLFPQEIGMAATWNPELIKHAGEITAYETRAAGVAWTFSPVLDLGVDPRWPRMWETFGEDPYLASVMGHNLIKGLQGDDNSLSDPNRIASCLKHFLGYSQTISGKDRSPAWIPEIMLREYHVPPFKAGVDAGAMTVMVNSGEINGIPTHVNKALLTGLLKDEWKFKGFIVTDWSDIEYLYTRHKVAESQKEAVKMAINAGIDMSMVPYNFEFAKHLVELVKAGEVPMERIDDAVTRILRVKYLLGLFDKPYTKLEDYPDFGSEKFAESARKTALESVTLLKNQDNMLPLAKNLRILVGGPAANSMRALNGGWSYSWQGELADEFAGQYQTIYEAIRDNASNPDQVQLFEGITYAATNDYRDEIVGDLNLFTRKAAQSDVVVLCIGENSYTEKPGDLEDLYLSENQQELVKVAAKTGKPVVLVLVEGRPRVISKIEPLSSAILHAYLTSNYGGEAVAKILFGIENPSGKLPYAYPRFPNSLEPYYHKHAEELEIAGSPTGTQYNPQYPFGYGLSYAQFEYSGLKTDKINYLPGETIKVEVSIRNTSAIAGKEVIQLYISDKVASVTPSVKRLRAFNKTMLLPGENKLITFEVPVNALAFVGTDNQWLVEKGEFHLNVGTLQTNIQVDQTNVVSPPAL